LGFFISFLNKGKKKASIEELLAHKDGINHREDERLFARLE